MEWICSLRTFPLPSPITCGCSRNGAYRGLSIACIAVEDSFGNPPRGRAAQVELTKRWIDHALVLGAPLVEVSARWAPAGESTEQA